MRCSWGWVMQATVQTLWGAKTRSWRRSAGFAGGSSRARAVPIAASARTRCEYRSARRRVGILPTKGSRADLALDRHHRHCCLGRPWLLWPGTLLEVAAPANFVSLVVRRTLPDAA